jgi:hypothetical protein
MAESDGESCDGAVGIDGRIETRAALMRLVNAFAHDDQGGRQDAPMARIAAIGRHARMDVVPEGTPVFAGLRHREVHLSRLCCELAPGVGRARLDTTGRPWTDRAMLRGPRTENPRRHPRLRGEMI